MDIAFRRLIRSCVAATSSLWGGANEAVSGQIRGGYLENELLNPVMEDTSERKGMGEAGGLFHPFPVNLDIESMEFDTMPSKRVWWKSRKPEKQMIQGERGR